MSNGTVAKRRVIREMAQAYVPVYDDWGHVIAAHALVPADQFSTLGIPMADFRPVIDTHGRLMFYGQYDVPSDQSFLCAVEGANGPLYVYLLENDIQKLQRPPSSYQMVMDEYCWKLALASMPHSKRGDVLRVMIFLSLFIIAPIFNSFLIDAGVTGNLIGWLGMVVVMAVVSLKLGDPRVTPLGKVIQGSIIGTGGFLFWLVFALL